MNCSICKDDPSLKKLWGCESPAQSVVWQNDEYRFFSCPIKFLTRQVTDFFTRYKAYKDGLARQPVYEDINSRFLEASFTYDMLINKSRMYEKEKKEAKDRQKNRLSLLKSVKNK